MNKSPLPMQVSLEGRFENFNPIRRDFKVVIEKKVPDTIAGGLIIAQWADVNKSFEKFLPTDGTVQHAFGPSPSAIIVYIESAEHYWSAMLNVEAYNGMTITLLGAQ